MEFSGIKLNVIEGSQDCRSIKTLYIDNSFFLYYCITYEHMLSSKIFDFRNLNKSNIKT